MVNLQDHLHMSVNKQTIRPRRGMCFVSESSGPDSKNCFLFIPNRVIIISSIQSPDAVENRNGNRTCPFLLKSRHMGVILLLLSGQCRPDLYNSYGTSLCTNNVRIFSE